MGRKICTDWGELNGKTIQRITLHNQFDRNTIIMIFTDKSCAILESTLPQAEIKLQEN